ncbi:MAG TPA: FGGY family carbohydrate kinase, partial [Terracidiphilus sp.]|nr:FGGY family carbohydrate kinase [Terracidiphilus sp.]
MPDYIGAIDQGTTSTRFMIFDRAGAIVASAQKEHQQIYPQPGWVEHDPDEIRRRTEEVVAAAMEQRSLGPRDLAAIGITNQRETTVLWNRTTGRPLYNALVWQDTRVADYIPDLARAGGPDRFRAQTGLPLATYFSALKIRWLLDRILGRTWCGMPNSASNSGSQSSVRRFINCVRLALVESVTWSPPCGPPVRCQTR